MVKIIACPISYSKASAPPSPAKFLLSPLGGGYPPPTRNALWKTLDSQEKPILLVSYVNIPALNLHLDISLQSNAKHPILKTLVL